MKKTQKLVKLKPEWILKNLSDTYYADGYGKATIETYSIENRIWIELALDSLEIGYYCHEEFDSSLGLVGDFIFEFDMFDIKDECPELYQEMVESNTSMWETESGKST